MPPMPHPTRKRIRRGTVLCAEEEGMVRQLDNLRTQAAIAKPNESHSCLFELENIFWIHLIPMRVCKREFAQQVVPVSVSLVNEIYTMV